MADNEIQDYYYPNIEPIDYIDESLDLIKARDDSAKHGFRRYQTLPNVTADDVGMEVYLVGDGTYKLISYDGDEPNWKKISDAKRNPAYTDWIEENYQPISNILTSLSKLTNNSNAVIYFAGPEDIQASAVSQTGLALIAGSDPAAMRETLALGDVATLTLPIDGSMIADGTLPQSKIDDNFSNNMGFSTGDVKLTYKMSPDTGWVFADDGSIGNAGSGATTRANADTEKLFKLMWNIPACTLQTYAGAESSKTTVAQDWQANKRLILPKVLGRALGIAGQGDGLSTRNLGQSLGSETIIMDVSNMPRHNHGLCTYQSVIGSKNGVYGCKSTGLKSLGSMGFAFQSWLNDEENYMEGGVSAETEGESVPTDNMQPTSFLNLMIKL